MRLKLTWGEGASYETPDFRIETDPDAAQLAVTVENALTELEVDWPVKVELIGGTLAIKWFWEQLNPLGRNFSFDEQARVDDLLYWLTDIYREGIEEAVVVVNYMRSLERRSKTYHDLKAYRDAARHDDSKVLLGARSDSSYREAIVQAKLMRWENVFPPRDPNVMADVEPVTSVLQFDDKYVVADRIKIG